MILNKDPLSWNRLEQVGNDARGQPLTASASGFPIVVRCNWQASDKAGSVQVSGLTVKGDAKCFTSYAGGKVGDRVSFNGEVFIVLGKRPELKLFSSGVDHYVYLFSRSETGVTAT